MKKVSLVVLLSSLVLPLSAFAGNDSNIAIFHNHAAIAVTVDYTVCEDATSSAKHMLGSTPCNNPQQKTLQLGAYGNSSADQEITIADDNNHYVATTEVNNMQNQTLFIAAPASAYNGCNTVSHGDSMSFFPNSNASVTCVIGEGLSTH